MSFTLKLLGGISLDGPEGAVTGPAVQRHRLALLAVLALSRPRAVSRDKLMALFWPEREIEPARQLLNQSVHALRRSLGADALLSVGEDLQLNPDVVRCDAVDFEAAIAAGDRERAVATYAGPLLDGFFLAEASEFEQWVDRERTRLRDACARALDGLAEAAERSGDWQAAAGWWKQRAALDRYDSRVALRLMQALEQTGNRAGALQHALAHQQLLKNQLEIEPAAEVTAYVERLRREPLPALALAQAPAPPGTAGGRDDPLVGRLVVPTFRPAGTRRVLIGGVLAAVAAIAWITSRRDSPRATNNSASVDEIAQIVKAELARRERGDTGRVTSERRTASIPAYELFLRGNSQVLLRSDSGARLALEYFRRAVALDSNYAAAWTGLARLTVRVNRRWDSMTAARATGETAALRAIALDDSLAEAHAIVGLHRAYAYDFTGAARHIGRAVELRPRDAWLRERMAFFYLGTDRPSQGLEEADDARQLDPLSPTATAVYAVALLANDRCDEALALLKSLEALDPPLLRVPTITARCLATKKRWAEAIALLRTPAAHDGGALSMLGWLLARSGARAGADSVQRVLELRWRDGELGAYLLARVPAGLGDRDEAFIWLNRAYEDRSLGYSMGVHLGLFDPVFRDLRSDPRFSALRKRLGL